ncbi:MAG: class I SAM-dependent methyltransferase [Planctomycetaceae bacterium]
MNWLHRLQSESSIRLVQTGLPRRLLRHLIFAHDIGVGSRVLDVGCGSGELVRFFDQLGVVATGVCLSADELSATRAGAPGLEFLETGGVEALRTQSRLFDMVTVRQSAAHAENLFSAEAFQATADLIDVLRPGGSLVFVLQHGKSQFAAASVSRHESSCCSQHFGVFPGACSTADFPTAAGQPDGWRWVLGQQPHSTTTTFTYTRAVNARERHDWRAIGEAAAQAKSGLCCQHLRACDADARYGRNAA